MKWVRALLVLLVAGSVAGLSRAQESPRDPAAASSQVSQENKSKKPDKLGSENLTKSKSQRKSVRSNNSLGLPLLKNIALDQKAIWTSPSHLSFQDATWLVPLGGLTAGLLATDRDTSRHLSNSPGRLDRSRKLSDLGAASLIGAAGGLYLWGKVTHDDHRRETGLLAGEALLNGLAVNTAVQLATGRERPSQDFGRGRFGQSGRSFPSDHAMAAWSVASVIGHEYPGPLTKVLAYGLASAVSASRVTGKEHFPSDVLVGSAIGWFIGQRVYRAHHNPELGGGSWETFSEMTDVETRQRPGNMGSPYVPLDSWAYPALERLAALGYIHTAFFGMRPWTRLECARLVDEAGDHLREEESETPEVSKIYRALESEFSPELQALGGGSNRRIQLESIYTRLTGIAGNPLRDGYHFGQTIVNDYGRPFAEGLNAVSGFSAWATAGSFAAYVRGEYQHAPSASALPNQARQFIGNIDGLPAPSSAPSPSVNQFRLLDTYVALNLENWQVSFGKQSLSWGPGLGGSMMFSNNADPINMFRINRVTPLKLPSILGWLGPMRVEFFLGQLAGYEFVFSPLGLIGQFGRSLDPQPFIHGQKISFKPTPNFEFGVSRTTIYGGPGYPFTPHTLARSLFSTGNELAGNPNKPGDRRSGVDFTYRIPKLRKWLVFYGDGFTDDEFSPIGYFDRSSWHAGIYIPQMPRFHRLDFRAEGVYTDNPLGGNLGHGFFYSNFTWRSGYRNQGNLIGSWIGREGQGAQAWTTYHFDLKNFVQLNFRHQKVSQEFVPGGGTLTNVGVRADFWVRSAVSVSSLVQYEKWTFPVLASEGRTNMTTSLQVTFWPRNWGKP